MNDIRVPELNGEGQFLSPAVIAHIKEIAEGSSPPVDPFDPSGSGANSIALGEGASSAGPSAVAVGSDTEAPQNLSTALGSGARATGESATAIGGTAVGYRSISIGRGSWADGDASVAIGPNAQSMNPREMVLGPAVQQGYPYKVRVPGQLIANEPTEPQHVATKAYVDGNAGGGGGGLPGIASGPGRPDYPETMSDPLPDGTVMYVSQDVMDGAPMWTIDRSGTTWYPVNATFDHYLRKGDGLRAVSATLDDEYNISGLVDIAVDSTSPTAKATVERDQFAITGLSASRTINQTLNVPEGSYFGIAAPAGSGLNAIVNVMSVLLAVGSDKKVGQVRSPSGTWSDLDKGVMTAVLPGPDGETVCIIMDEDSQPIPELSGARGFRIQSVKGHFDINFGWPHVPTEDQSQVS